MKKITILFLFLISTSLSQAQPVVSDFLISGDDNTPSTFTQYFPQLTVVNDRNFLMFWWDFREGVPDNFAQKFDSSGNKIGANFNTNSNIGTYLKKNGYLLSLDQVSSSSSYFPYFEINAALYNDLNNKIFEEEIFSGLIPDCGTGFINGENLVSAADSSFYFLTNYSGIISLTKIEDNGNLKTFPQFNEQNNIGKITNAATKDGNYFFAWIKAAGYDSIESGLYATFIDYRDSIIVPQLFITYLSDSNQVWDYIPNYNIKSVALNDSIYKLFWLNNSTLKLYSVKLNTKGEIISDVDSLLIPKLDAEFSEPSRVIITNKNEEGFFLYISQRYMDDIYQSNFIKYNPEGAPEGTIVSQTSESEFTNSLFYLGSNKFFKPSSDGKDVYLEKTEFFSLIEKIKINDDASGSNEENNASSRFDGNSIFSIWNDEEKTYGTAVDKNGNVTGEKIELPSSSILFFINKDFISTWTNKADDSTYNAGYSIYDQEFNEKFSKTLFSAPSPYNVSIQAKIISDSSVVLLLKTYEELKLILENINGVTIKEKIVESEENISGEKIFQEESDAFFWIIWNDKLQKYGYDLEPQTEAKTRQSPYAINNYIGDDRFLIITTNVDYPLINLAVLGTIVSSDGDTVASNLHLAYGKRDDYNLLVDRLDENEFLVTWKISNKFYGRAFSNDGIAAKDSFLINKSSSSFNRDVSFIVNDNKVYFTWSEVRTPAYGFDIYGSIFDLSIITSINEETPSIPKDYYLYQNYPNPFNPYTKIKFAVPEFSRVTIKVYDVLGKEICSLIDEDKHAGIYYIDFNGSIFASGVYFYKITAKNFAAVKKMMLIK